MGHFLGCDHIWWGFVISFLVICYHCVCLGSIIELLTNVASPFQRSSYHFVLFCLFAQLAQSASSIFCILADVADSSPLPNSRLVDFEQRSSSHKWNQTYWLLVDS